MIIIFISIPFYKASGGSATPWERLFPIAVPKLFYIRDTYFLYSSLLYFTYCSLNQKPKNISFTQYAFLSCYLEHYLVLLFQYLIQELLDFSLPAPCGIDIFISKLATNDLCTCSHQAIFWRRCRGAKRCKSLYFCLFILVLLNLVFELQVSQT